MSGIPDKTGPAQVIEFSRRVTGRNSGKIPVRLKARHLSESLHREIIELFDVHMSHDDVADIISQREHLKGVTGKTVAEVVDLFNVRKMVQSERRPIGVGGYRVVRGAA